MWEAAGFSEDQAFQTSLITTGVNVAFTLGAIALSSLFSVVPTKALTLNRLGEKIR
jgi:hypothetical protein